ncbi:MAG: RNA pseudouridine synthase [Niameybacter sp.]|uniref:pseudouridine synthase n=1 Tax=Niameybacter sp. TaxID=2033640 RepID=UPI002FC6BA19
MRINKLLSNKGICSRKQAALWIEAGRIQVNGEKCIPGQWVEAEDDIRIDQRPIWQCEKIYLVLNKPEGITCTAAEDVENNIINYLKYPEYIFPVGRLDKASRGLILLTNDGDLAHQILAADNHHEKEYIVTVDKPFGEDFLLSLAKGVNIGKVTTRPCKVQCLGEDTFSITLTQGLNRQIRKMTKHFGYTVTRLERVRILNIKMENLPYGAWRVLTEAEIASLKK